MPISSPDDTDVQSLANESATFALSARERRALETPPQTRAKTLAERRKGSERLMVHLALLCISIGFLLPFVWMLSTSLKSLDQTMAFPPQFIPKPILPGNYWRALTSPQMDFPLFTRNTLIVALGAVLGTVVSSSIVAYGFAKIDFKGRGLLFGLMLATMMIPFPVMMVSLFSIFRWLTDNTPIQWMGTLKPLWVPAWFGSAFNIFLLRQFFLTIPEELSESARLDGCSEWTVFVRIILPLARPALAVVSLFTFMGVWNDFLGPLVYLQYPQQYTLALGLQSFQSQQGGTEWNILMAASILVLSPIVILFFLAQRTFIQGIATTGMK